MNIKRFFGKNSKLALAQVRESLGDDAIILSNRAVTGGNEIMAVSVDDMETIATSADTQVALPAEAIENSRISSLEALFQQRIQSDNERINHLPIDATVNADNKHAIDVAAALAQTQAQAKEVNAQIASMMLEIRNMRNVIEAQLAEISWGATQQREPIKSSILGTMLSAGFSAGLSKQLADHLPDNQSETEAKKWVASVLVKNLQAMSAEEEMLDKGGIFAIIGPTGVGKTTTTAKLAARYVMKHGTDKIGLITTDSYRVGGHEQLRIYGKILGVMVHSVKDEADLKIALNELKGKHTILIDTVGVSQRDKMVADQVAMLSDQRLNIQKLLCLNSTNTGDTLIDVIRAYRGQGLAGCVMTKIDEAMTVGNIIDVMVREKLKLFYVTNGQRVPEDLHLANKQQLVHRAFQRDTVKDSPFTLQQEDQPLIVGNTVRSPTNRPVLELDHV
jgi:flagellar biosynthesis protein FlhF